MCRNRGVSSVHLRGDTSSVQHMRVNTECEVFDDFRSKIEAWKTAVHIVSQLFLIDKEVITGEENSDL